MLDAPAHAFPGPETTPLLREVCDGRRRLGLADLIALRSAPAWMPLAAERPR